jgi:hypothetical protein
MQLELAPNQDPLPGTPPWQVRPIDTWAGVKAFLAQLRSGYIFRGQRSNRWLLESSLERAVRAANLSRSALDAEEVMVADFKKRAHHYLLPPHLPPADSTGSSYLEWLALMQHHGAPTRLLDWTRSAYVAAYFAIEDVDDSCAIWCLDADWCLSQVSRAVPDFRGRRPVDLISSPQYLDLATGNSTPGIYPVEPPRLNERMSVQQGLFTVFGSVQASFRSNLEVYAGDLIVDAVLQLVIPAAVREEALSDLQTMNITRASLFPGLDGFAQSLKYLLSARRHYDAYWRTPEENAERVRSAATELDSSMDLSTLPRSALVEFTEQRVADSFRSFDFQVSVDGRPGKPDLLVTSSRTGSILRVFIKVVPTRNRGSLDIWQSSGAWPEFDILVLGVHEKGRLQLFAVPREDLDRMGLFTGTTIRRFLIPKWRAQLQAYRMEDVLARLA